jgi:hypothetical protein
LIKGLIKRIFLQTDDMEHYHPSVLPVLPAHGYNRSTCVCCLQVELLSWQSVKDIAGDGGVIKTVVVEGDGW